VIGNVEKREITDLLIFVWWQVVIFAQISRSQILKAQKVLLRESLEYLRLFARSNRYAPFLIPTTSRFRCEIPRYRANDRPNRTNLRSLPLRQIPHQNLPFPLPSQPPLWWRSR